MKSIGKWTKRNTEEFTDTREKIGSLMERCIDLKKANDSVKREVLYNILLEFGVPKNLVRLIKMCLNETYSKVRAG
jgi:hypothetical protein